MKHVLVAFSLLLTACRQSGQGGGKGDLNSQLEGITADNAVMREAEAAANNIVRNATDCDAVKANLAETNRKLDEAQTRIRTETGRTTLNALKTQVRNIAQLCP